MTGWEEYILAYIVFFASHRVPLIPGVKRRLLSALGQTGFTFAYSLLSVAILYWLILSAARAPYIELWEWARWQNHVPLTFMLPVFLIAALSIARPNPFSFGGAGNERFNPHRPGIIRITRHPLLLALGLWALAHIVPNGNLAHVILFAGFALFAFAGRRLIDRRRQRDMGQSWHDKWQIVRAQPIFQRPENPAWFMFRLALGSVSYIGFLHLHQWLFGVSPLT